MNAGLKSISFVKYHHLIAWYFIQASDPWGRSSPAVDPWQSNTGAISKQSVPSLASASNIETWISRTQPPLAAPGPSNDAWLQNGNMTSNSTPLSDPWLTKAPQKLEQPDPWLSKASDSNDAWQQPANAKPAVVDPWAPTDTNIGVCLINLYFQAHF